MLTPTAEIKTDDEGYLVVTPSWFGEPLDRPGTTSYSCGKDTPGHRKLALRFVQAIKAGAVFTNPHVARDTAGKTFVTCGSRILCRQLNADLKRLGF